MLFSLSSLSFLSLLSLFSLFSHMNIQPSSIKWKAEASTLVDAMLQSEDISDVYVFIYRYLREAIKPPRCHGSTFEAETSF